MPKLLSGMTSMVKMPIVNGLLQSEGIYLEATFASGVATVTEKSHDGITMTRDSTTGRYDLVLPPAKKYLFTTVELIDATADQSALVIIANWEQENPAAGTRSVRFMTQGGVTASVAPANSTRVRICMLGFKGK